MTESLPITLSDGATLALVLDDRPSLEQAARELAALERNQSTPRAALVQARRALLEAAS